MFPNLWLCCKISVMSQSVLPHKVLFFLFSVFIRVSCFILVTYPLSRFRSTSCPVSHLCDCLPCPNVLHHCLPSPSVFSLCHLSFCTTSSLPSCESSSIFVLCSFCLPITCLADYPCTDLSLLKTLELVLACNLLL